ncbi:hypothetical protein [Streptomonospora litoralis]|uniref:Uncharacterized protein n=1 Tax=Streptomonospora litoralis TaxID=2498135 RepID=A0A4P6PZI9_9ACTN|nr:hypothetical protein [Streptomonospora litoralis]QBI53615.1 hypothetical protein EKD16_09105 [Streptomonospora litoralis]
MQPTVPQPANPGIRRLCINADVKNYSGQDDVGQLEVQRALPELLTAACERAGLDRAFWARQEQGDGELALLPPGIDEAYTISGLVRELRVGLFHYNRHRSERSRMRLRLAAHEGITYLADSGYAGDAVVTVSRLCASAAVKDALAADARADLALIVSDRVYADVVSQNVFDLFSADFTEVAVSEPAKGFAARAWVYLPGRPPTGPDEAAGSAGAGPGDSGGDGGRVDESTTNTVGDVGGNNTSARDVSGTVENSTHKTVDNSTRYGDTYESIRMDGARGVSFGGHHEHHDHRRR